MNLTSGNAAACLRILLVDDMPLARLGLAQLINRETDMCVCGDTAATPQVLSLMQTLAPALLILDTAPRGASLLGLISTIHRRRPGLPVLAWSAYDERLYALRALQAGARGYLPKQTSPTMLVQAIRQVIQGNVILSEGLTTQLAHTALCGQSRDRFDPLWRLSVREFEVLHYIAQGYSLSEIATALYLSVKTVATHRAHLLAKLGLPHHRALCRQAVYWLEGFAQPRAMASPSSESHG